MHNLQRKTKGQKTTRESKSKGRKVKIADAKGSMYICGKNVLGLSCKGLAKLRKRGGRRNRNATEKYGSSASGGRIA